MITRFALFEGVVPAHDVPAFRAAVLAEVLPHWQSFPGVLAVRVCFENERDEGAPEMPLVLAITYPDRAAVDTALASPQRARAKAATDAILARYFTGRVHHHITQAHEVTVF
jgi:hypothetical protein